MFPIHVICADEDELTRKIAELKKKMLDKLSTTFADDSQEARILEQRAIKEFKKEVLKITTEYEAKALAGDGSDDDIPIISTALSSIGSIAIGTEEKIQSLSLLSKRQLRRLVSGNKARYQKNGYDLDLNYITERIIAMSLPSEGLESMYRNPIEEVVRFFHTKHGLANTLLFNLCKERVYDYSKFRNQVIVCPINDHEVTSLTKINEFCVTCENWLNKNPRNVIGVHCRGGKGRTGLMVCSLLLHLRAQDDPLKALEYFALKRTSEGSQPVRVEGPSQVRYVTYYSELIKKGIESNIPQPSVKLSHILIDSYTSVYHPSVRVICQDVVVKEVIGKEKVDNFGNKPFFISLDDFVLQGDVKIVLFAAGTLYEDIILYFYFHTNFLPENGKFRLSKNDLDIASKDTENKIFPETFGVELNFSAVSQ